VKERLCDSCHDPTDAAALAHGPPSQAPGSNGGGGSSSSSSNGGSARSLSLTGFGVRSSLKAFVPSGVKRAVRGTVTAAKGAVKGAAKGASGLGSSSPLPSAKATKATSPAAAAADSSPTRVSMSPAKAAKNSRGSALPSSPRVDELDAPHDGSVDKGYFGEGCDGESGAVGPCDFNTVIQATMDGESDAALGDDGAAFGPGRGSENGGDDEEDVGQATDDEDIESGNDTDDDDDEGTGGSLRWPGSGSSGGVDGRRSLLASCGLGRFFRALDAFGFETLGDLLDPRLVVSADLEGPSIGMSPADVAAFRAAVARATAALGTAPLEVPSLANRV
jgi:hypothetical protein